MPPEGRVQNSILDRLIDEEPNSSVEVAPSNSQALRIYRAAVRRDLEWLLNSRRTVELPEEGLEQTKRSVYNFGLPDFSSYGAGSVQTKSKLARAIQEAIERFEPRIMNVEVVPVESEPKEGVKERQLHFTISGLLKRDPVPEQIAFDTRLELSKGDYRVQET